MVAAGSAGRIECRSSIDGPFSLLFAAPLPGCAGPLFSTWQRPRITATAASCSFAVGDDLASLISLQRWPRRKCQFRSTFHPKISRGGNRGEAMNSGGVCPDASGRKPLPNPATFCHFFRSWTKSSFSLKCGARDATFGPPPCLACGRGRSQAGRRDIRLERETGRECTIRNSTKSTSTKRIGITTGYAAANGPDLHLTLAPDPLHNRNLTHNPNFALVSPSQSQSPPFPKQTRIRRTTNGTPLLIFWHPR